MPLKLGSTTIGSLYLGSTKIAAAYLGSTKIYEASAPTPLTFVQQNFPVQWPTGSPGLQFPENLSGSDIQSIQIRIVTNNEPSANNHPLVELYTSPVDSSSLPNPYALISGTPVISDIVYDSSTHLYSATYTFNISSNIASDLSSGNLYAYIRTDNVAVGDIDGYDNTLCGYWATSGGGGGGNITWNPSGATISHEAPSQISELQIAVGTTNTTTGIETITIDGSGLQNDTWASKSIVVTLVNTLAGIRVDLTLPSNGGTFGTVQYNIDLSTIYGAMRPTNIYLLGSKNSSWNSWETVTGNITVSSEPASNGGGGDYDEEFE